MNAVKSNVARGLCPYCRLDARTGPYAHANRQDCIDAMRAAHLAYQQRIGRFVLNRLEEVTNEIGGVIGYTLKLDAKETERLCKEMDNY